MTDAASLVLAFFVAHSLRFGFEMTRDLSLIVLGGPFIWIGIFAAWRLYSPEHLSAPDEFRRALSAVTTSVLVVALGSYWARTAFSREWMALSWVLGTVLVLLTREIWRSWIQALKASGDLSFRTLVVGGNYEADRISNILSGPGSGFKALGLVSLKEPPPEGGEVAGSLDEFRQIIQSRHIECLFVASSSVDTEDMRTISLAARFEGVELRVSANLPEMLTSRLGLQPVGSLMALSLRPPQLTSLQTVAKRAFDLSLAVPLFVLTLPLVGALAALIRLTSPGKAFFIQPRVTKGGALFPMYKLRTMRGPSGSQDEGLLIDTTAPFFKNHEDPRITPVGAWLRRLSLDELPQLLNVIKGEMSLVGPRPLPADQVAANMELLAPRHAVPAGITGWWQVRGRSSLNSEEAVKIDLFYIENWSLSFDLYILLKTAGAVLSRKGAV